MAASAPARDTPWIAGVLVVVAGLVLWHYQAVESPEALVGQVAVVIWLVLFTAACWGAGWPLWLALGGERTPSAPEAWVVIVATGAWLLALWATLLGLAGVLHPVLLVVPLLALAAGGALMWRRTGPRLQLGWMRREPVPAFFLVAAAVVTLLVLRAPSPHYDQLHYHLAFPFHWLRDGRLVVFDRHAYSLLPANMGALYTYALALLGPWAAQAVHWWMGAVAVGGVYGLGRRLGGPRAGLWAAAVLATTSSVVATSVWAGSDLGVCAFAVAAWAVVVTARRRPGSRKGWWLLAGALVGAAVGCKYQAGLTVAIPLFVVLLVLPGRRLVRITAAGIGSAAAFAPWAVRSLVATGNPVYPYLGRVFAALGWVEAPEGAARLAQGIGSFPAELPGVGWLLTLGTFAPRGDAGAIGPVHLLLLPAVVWMLVTRRRGVARPLALAVVVGVAGWSLAPQLGRYLLPVLAVLAALAGFAWCELRRVCSPAVGRALQVLVVAAMAWSLVGGTAPITFIRMSAAMGRTPADDYLGRFVSYWPAVQFVNQELPADARVLLVAEARSMYFDRALVVEDTFRTPLLSELAESSPSAEEMARTLHEQGVTHVLVNRHEAQRMAVARGREDYFGALSPAARGRLLLFLSESLRPLMSEGTVEVSALVPPTD